MQTTVVVFLAGVNGTSRVKSFRQSQRLVNGSFDLAPYRQNKIMNLQ